MRRNILLAPIAILFALLLLIAFMRPLFDGGDVGYPPDEGSTLSDIDQIQTALRSYHQEYETYPSGSPAEIASSLFGGNSRKLILLDPSVFITDMNGQILDYWKNPFKITVVEAYTPKVYSAGKDRIFGNTDDISIE